MDVRSDKGHSTWLTHEARGPRREEGQRRADTDSGMTIDDRRASFRSPLSLARLSRFLRVPPDPGDPPGCRRRSGNTHFLPWPRNLGDYHFPPVSPPIAGAQRYPTSSSSSSSSLPITTTNTSTTSRRPLPLPPLSLSLSPSLSLPRPQQPTNGRSSRRLVYYCQTVSHPLACHVSTPVRSSP